MSLFSRRCRAWPLATALCWSVVVGAPAAAQDSPGPPAGQAPSASTPSRPPLNLRGALRRALAAHPDLQGFEAERDEIDAARRLAGRSPTPEVGLLLEDAFGSGSRAGTGGAQWTLSVMQALELGDQRAARRDVADARGDALRDHQAQRRRDALAEVAQRFIEAAIDAQRQTLAERQVDLAQQTLAAATRRVEAARAPLAERSRAQAARAKALLEREHAEHESLAARVALATRLGVAEPDFGELQADLFVLPPMRPLAELRAQLATSPAAQVRLAEAAVIEAERRAALATAGLKPTLTGGVRRYGANDDTGLVLGVSLPLFAGRAAHDQAAAAAAQLARSEAENRAAGLRAGELLYDRYQELGHAREALHLLDVEVLPALIEALDQTRYAYDRGRYGYLELAQAQTELAAARRERLDTVAHYHSLLAELERLTGEPLLPDATP